MSTPSVPPADLGPVVPGASLLTDDDLHLFAEGRHYRLYEKMGARLGSQKGRDGVFFSVWAPSASRVSVIGDFNRWEAGVHSLAQGSGGVWSGFLPDLQAGARYKYRIVSADGERFGDKSDPFALQAEMPPQTASVVCDPAHAWRDAVWLTERAERQVPAQPMSIYEVHLGSWRRPGGELPTYREIAAPLAAYGVEHGFTHVELMPVMEHPFYASWGYQVTGFFAPTRRYGPPEDLMFLVDELHEAGIGVLFDWVPSHFPGDAHGLVYFDGTHLYEHADPKRGWQPDWKSYVFDYGKPQVRSFLISSALFWLDRFHGDGLRVDAVASMIYLNYSRREGEWAPNQYGGNENLEAVGFLRDLNQEVERAFPDALTVAEESTSWPMVTQPAYLGGLGFDLKWDMGWMNDSLAYFKVDPLYRRYRHECLTFRRMYAFSEKFCLALSHDEVVHGKRSLRTKMPGNDARRLANLRLLLGYQWALSGKKLLFMGGEIAQAREWSHDRELDWSLLEEPGPAGIQRWVRDLNRLYRAEPALHRLDHDAEGFEWVDCTDSEQGVVSFLRRGGAGHRPFLVVLNLTPVVRRRYRVGAPLGGRWEERLNSDAEAYGGEGVGNLGFVEAEPVPLHGRTHTLTMTLPGLAALFFKGPEPEPEPVAEEEIRVPPAERDSAPIAADTPASPSDP